MPLAPKGEHPFTGSGGFFMNIQFGLNLNRIYHGDTKTQRKPFQDFVFIIA
jgi:hypothetical protein